MLKISGDLAQEYAKIIRPQGGGKSSDGLTISTIAVIAHQLKDDQVRIEHSAPVTFEGSPDRLVTLTATVDKKALRSFVRTAYSATMSLPAGEQSGKRPAVGKPIHYCTRVLALADLKGVKLRSWTLASEVGE